MRVSPASELPMMCTTGEVAIVNLQRTPKDNQATHRIFGKTDLVMELLMDNLGLEIPNYSDACEPDQVIPN